MVRVGLRCDGGPGRAAGLDVEAATVPGGARVLTHRGVRSVPQGPSSRRWRRCVRRTRAAGCRPALREERRHEARRGRRGAGRRPAPPPRRTGPGRSRRPRWRTRCRPWPSSRAWSARSPVSPTASWNAFAWARPFWPVVASSTKSVSGCGAGQALVDDPADLGQLVHEVRLRVQAAGGVDDDDVRAARDGRVERVVDDGAGVGARRRGRRPGRRRGRPRSGAGRWRRRGTCRRRRGAPSRPSRRVAARELADRRRLAGAVDADDEDDRRPARDRRLRRPGRRRAATSSATRARRGRPPRRRRVAARARPLDDVHRERRARRRRR